MVAKARLEVEAFKFQGKGKSFWHAKACECCSVVALGPQSTPVYSISPQLPNLEGRPADEKYIRGRLALASPAASYISRYDIMTCSNLGSRCRAMYLGGSARALTNG